MNRDQLKRAVREIPPEIVLTAASRLWDNVRDRAWRGLHRIEDTERPVLSGSSLVILCPGCAAGVSLSDAGVFRWGRCCSCGTFWWI